jgi:hypothetical protein
MHPINIARTTVQHIAIVKASNFNNMVDFQRSPFFIHPVQGVPKNPKTIEITYC